MICIQYTRVNATVGELPIRTLFIHIRECNDETILGFFFFFDQEVTITWKSKHMVSMSKAITVLTVNWIAN